MFLLERTAHACAVFRSLFIEGEGVAGFEPRMHARRGWRFVKTETLL